MPVWFDRLPLPGFYRLCYHLWTRSRCMRAAAVRKHQAHSARVYCPPYYRIGAFSLLAHSNRLSAHTFHAMVLPLANRRRSFGWDGLHVPGQGGVAWSRLVAPRSAHRSPALLYKK